MARRRAYTSKAGWQDDGTVSDRSGGCLCALFFDRSQNLRTNHQQVFHIVWHGTFINALHTNSLTYQHKTTFTASQTPSGLEPGLPLVIRSTAPSFPWPCSTQCVSQSLQHKSLVENLWHVSLIVACGENADEP